MTMAREVFEEQYISKTKKSKEIYEEARHYLAGGVAMIKELEKPGFYERIDGSGERIRSGLVKLASDIGLAIQVGGIRSLFSVHFNSHPLRNIRDILSGDRETSATFYTGLESPAVFISQNIT